MKNYSIHMPSYSIGDRVYEKIKEICSPYGATAVVIGGYTAMEKSKEKLLSAAKGAVDILDFIWYGGEASYENVDMLRQNELVNKADMLLAVGGGKALDTVKCLGVKINKPVFSFPTIASNCAACTSVSIMYRPDGSFIEPFFFSAPPVHAFIDTDILVHSPAKYIWAGMGDTYAKYFEATVSSRGEDLEHYLAMGVNVSKMCYDPIMSYGRKALESARTGVLSRDYEQVVLAIIVTTGVASIFLTAEHTVDYNSGFAHAIFYSLTTYPHIEKEHLHGEVVSYGVLNLLLADGDMRNFEKVYAFSKDVGLPVCLKDLGFESGDIGKLAKNAASMKDVEHNPYPVTSDMIADAMKTLEERNKK